jgi:hypothetical protein
METVEVPETQLPILEEKFWEANQAVIEQTRRWLLEKTKK